MSVSIYSTYDEFKFSDPESCEYLESVESEYEDDLDEDQFFYTESKLSSIDDASFYIVADTEDEDIAEDISNYLGKFTKFFIADLHKKIFIVK
jgi:hypothetical protein